MATTRLPVQAQVSLGIADRRASTHIRKQIQRIRLSKGWTKQDLEQAAGMASDSLGDLEAGIVRISVDVLRKIIEALGSDITDVWPSAQRASNMETSPRPVKADDPLNFSRLAEIHSLTGAEASCLFAGRDRPGFTAAAAVERPKSEFRVLSSINLARGERGWLRRKLVQWTVTTPWAVYLYSENGRSLCLCLKNARLEFWAEGFIERCLSSWLAAPPL